MRQIVLGFLLVAIVITFGLMLLATQQDKLENPLAKLKEPIMPTFVVEVPVTRVVEVTREVIITVVASPTPFGYIAPTETPAPTPPPDFGDAEWGSPDWPVAIGEPAGMYIQTDDGNDQGFDVTVLNVHRGDEAMRRILETDPDNPPPPDGYEFVLLLVKVDADADNPGLIEFGPSEGSILTNGEYIKFDDEADYTPCCLKPPFEFQLSANKVQWGYIALPVWADDPEPLFLLGSREYGVYFSLNQ